MREVELELVGYISFDTNVYIYKTFISFDTNIFQISYLYVFRRGQSVIFYLIIILLLAVVIALSAIQLNQPKSTKINQNDQVNQNQPK